MKMRLTNQVKYSNRNLNKLRNTVVVTETENVKQSPGLDPEEQAELLSFSHTLRKYLKNSDTKYETIGYQVIL